MLSHWVHQGCSYDVVELSLNEALLASFSPASNDGWGDRVSQDAQLNRPAAKRIRGGI